MPFDYKRQDWARPGDWKWKAIAVRRETLPRLFPPGQQMGEVTEQAARETGLGAGTPVIAAAADKACELLGAGCLEPEQGCISYGTTATFNVNFPCYTEPVPLLPPYPSAVPGCYNLEFQVYRGFWLVSWFIKEFGALEKGIARREGVAAEEILDRFIDNTPPGSMGLVLQPYWSPGLKFPGLEAKGAIIGFGEEHTKAHLYRALIEGLAYAMREGRDRIEKRTRRPVKHLIVCGGGSKSNRVMQVTADVFNLQACRPAVSEAAGLGAAILAAFGAGLHSDLATAVKEMTRTSQDFEPDPAVARLYDDIYRRVYRTMYRRLRFLYRDIRSITGYPPLT